VWTLAGHAAAGRPEIGELVASRAGNYDAQLIIDAVDAAN
jgi:hypothetical protein